MKQEDCYDPRKYEASGSEDENEDEEANEEDIRY
jgi:hypothetical protein